MERELSQEAAERLLSGDLASPPNGTERLAALLAAASAPGLPDELAGEAAAMAAFRAQPQIARRWSLRRALIVKVAAVVAATTVAAGGVAVASSAGLLPIPFIPSKVNPAPPGTDGPAERSPGHGRATNPGHSPPSESLPALCAEYQKKSAAEKPKELKGKHFEVLVQEAKGAENVDAFCAKVLGATPTPSKGKEGDSQGNGIPGTPGNDTQGEDGQGGAGPPKPAGPATPPPAGPAAPQTAPPSTPHKANPTG